MYTFLLVLNQATMIGLFYLFCFRMKYVEIELEIDDKSNQPLFLLNRIHRLEQKVRWTFKSYIVIIISWLILWTGARIYSFYTNWDERGFVIEFEVSHLLGVAFKLIVYSFLTFLTIKFQLMGIKFINLLNETFRSHIALLLISLLFYQYYISKNVEVIYPYIMYKLDKNCAPAANWYLRISPLICDAMEPLMCIFIITVIRLMAQDMTTTVEESQQYEIFESGYMNNTDGVPDLDITKSEVQ